MKSAAGSIAKSYFQSRSRSTMSMTQSDLESQLSRLRPQPMVQVGFPENQPVNVLLHGIFGSSRDWSHLSTQISNITRAPTLNLDLLNHGNAMMSRSMSYDLLAEHVISVMDSYNVTSANLIGHSMGGKTAQIIALTQPERVNSLVVVDTAPTTYAHVPQMAKFVQILTDLEIEEHDDKQHFIENMLQPMIKSTGVLEQLSRNIIEPDMVTSTKLRWNFDLSSISQSVYNLVCAKFPTEAATNQRSDLNALFVKGGKSKYLEGDVVNRVFEYFPNARIEEVKQGDHLLHIQESKTFLDIITEYYDELRKQKERQEQDREEEEFMNLSEYEAPRV